MIKVLHRIMVFTMALSLCISVCALPALADSGGDMGEQASAEQSGTNDAPEAGLCPGESQGVHTEGSSEKPEEPGEVGNSVKPEDSGKAGKSEKPEESGKTGNSVKPEDPGQVSGAGTDEENENTDDPMTDEKADLNNDSGKKKEDKKGNSPQKATSSATYDSQSDNAALGKAGAKEQEKENGQDKSKIHVTQNPSGVEAFTLVVGDKSYTFTQGSTNGQGEGNGSFFECKDVEELGIPKGESRDYSIEVDGKEYIITLTVHGKGNTQDMSGATDQFWMSIQEKSNEQEPDDDDQDPNDDHKPGGDQEPGDEQKPGDGNKPGGDKEPGDEQKPGDDHKPGGGKEPGDEQKPDDDHKPGGGKEPGDEQKPDDGPKPGGGQNPGDSDVVIVTDSPAKLTDSRADAANDGDLDAQPEIPDEEVPPAKAPVTGDISALWLALSGLSGSGMLLLNRKRKEA